MKPNAAPAMVNITIGTILFHLDLLLLLLGYTISASKIDSGKYVKFGSTYGP